MLTDRWNRGKVTQVSEEENQVDVFFVDYGDAEFVSCNDVMPLPVVLRRLPFQAIECSCLDIEPAGLEWDDGVCDLFYNLHYNKNFIAQVCNKYTLSAPHSVSTTQPAYLHSVLKQYVPSHHSSDCSLLAVPHVHTCFGSRSFAVAAPTTWNSLPRALAGP